MQPPLQVLLRPGINESDVGAHVSPRDDRLLLVANRSLALGVMPVSRFMTGRTYCVQRLDKVKFFLVVSWNMSGNMGHSSPHMCVMPVSHFMTGRTYCVQPLDRVGTINSPKWVIQQGPVSAHMRGR